MKSDKKRQHFVPRFYLKKFSNRNDGKSLSAFFKNISKFNDCVSIEGQAQKPFYYGEDGKLENSLMKIEYHASIVLNKVCEIHKIIKEPFEDYFRILHFIINIYTRNPNQAETLLRSDEGFNNHFAKHKSSPYIDSLLSNKLTSEKAIEFSISQSSRISRMCLDLSAKLILNETKTPFITSDNPTIKYNIISESYEMMSASFTSIGLQIFLPLSPNLMIMFYDPEAYKIQGVTGDIISIKEESEIFQLNLLQVLNCTNCLYFNEGISESDILSLLAASGKYTSPNKVIPIEFGSYFFQKISELKINLCLASIQPLREQIFIPQGRFVFPMRPHAQKMREYFEKNRAQENK